MITIRGRWLARTEYALFAALAVVLPIFESLKNLILFLLLLLSVIRIVGRDFTWRRPDRVEVSLLFILAVCFLSTAINWPLFNGLKGLKDTLAQVLVFWLIYRAGYSERQHYGLAVAVVVGVMFGLGWGIVNVLLLGRGPLQFHSAGIVTQSAIYLGIALIVTLAVTWLETGHSTELRAKAVNSLWWMATAIMMIGLFLMGSRGAILAVLITVLVLMIAVRERRLWLIMTGLVAAALALAITLPDRFDQQRLFVKFLKPITTGTFVEADQERIDYWRIAAAHITQGDSPVFGVGPRNFQSIDASRLHFDPPLRLSEAHLAKLGHAHNLFLTKLVEEGLAGLAALVFLFGLVARNLWRAWRRKEWYDWRWFAAFGALGVPVIAGFVNTPFYQEHAMLAMVLMAMFMQSSQPVGHRR